MDLPSQAAGPTKYVTETHSRETSPHAWTSGGKEGRKEGWQGCGL